MRRERGRHDPHCSSNDIINLTIVRGMTIIEGLMVAGILVLAYQVKPVPGEVLQFASMIGAGLLGYLSREYKPGDQSGSHVSVDNVEHQIVEGEEADAQPAPEVKET